MKAKELRTGNLVNYKKDLIKTTSRTILNIDEMNAVYKPIPLTEEWLLKFGFEKIVFDSEETGYGIEYRLDINNNTTFVIEDDFSFGIENKQLNTHWLELDFDIFTGIHQLQNLYFALTQKELEWKIK